MKCARCPVGEEACPGLKAGGFLREVWKFATVQCLGKDIPPYVVADISGLELGQSLSFRDLRLPEGSILDPDTYGTSNKTNPGHAVLRIAQSK